MPSSNVPDARGPGRDNAVPERLPVRGLVERLGGEERLLEILRLFYARMAEDLIVGFFFAGHDLEQIVQGQHAFLLRATGTRDWFNGKHPSVAHRGLTPILRGHFDRRLVLLTEILEQEGVAPGDRDAWLRLESGFRAVVQARPTSDDRPRTV